MISKRFLPFNRRKLTPVEDVPVADAAAAADVASDAVHAVVAADAADAAVHAAERERVLRGKKGDFCQCKNYFRRRANCSRVREVRGKMCEKMKAN